jgi:hypothetical protein
MAAARVAARQVVEEVIAVPVPVGPRGLLAPKNTTVLGENMMERVIPYSEKTGSRPLFFGTTADEWAKMTPRQRWKLNDGALRVRINEGNSFKYIGRDPYLDPMRRKQFDLTKSELFRLEERGVSYRFISRSEVLWVLRGL